MAVTPASSDVTRKCGVVLTCFDNGRKRFKAVPLESESATVDDVIPAQEGCVADTPALVPATRRGRPAS